MVYDATRAFNRDIKALSSHRFVNIKAESFPLLLVKQ